MGLVDLRGREHDERVAPLLALAAGHQAESAERTTQRSRPGEWTFIGWEVDGLVVACAGVSRSGDGDVELHSVAVAPGRRGNGFGRAIVDALAEVVNAPSISAAAGEDAVGFYRACGFSVEPAPEDGGGRLFRCTRPLAARVDPSPAVIVTLAGIEAAVRAAWSEQTADDPATWSSDNPARHHCDVTSLLVRELLGGEILIANVILDGRRVERRLESLAVRPRGRPDAGAVSPRRGACATDARRTDRDRTRAGALCALREARSRSPRPHRRGHLTC